MVIEVYSPSSPLRHIIESFIYYRDFHVEHNLDRLLPDGNITLIIDLKDARQGIYDNHTLREIQSCRYTWLSGIRSQPIIIPSGRDSEMFIVNFHKGRSFPLIQVPLSVYTDHVVDSELVFGNVIHELRAMLCDTVSISQKFSLAETFFLSLAGSHHEVNPFIDYAVGQILHAPGQKTIAEISNKVGYSQKHLIQLFKTHVGMTPKSFMRVIRFQKVIRDIETSTQVDWRTIAFDSGYFDHAHFIHDFREFCGMTPLQYLAAKNDQLNYIPVG